MASLSQKKSDFLILIVDDEIDFLTSMEFWFKTQGYAVAVVSRGEEAIEFLKTRTPSVVFLDYLMPGLSGLETLARIRNIAPNLPVIMLTAHAPENVRVEAYRHGVNGIFDKSLDFYKADHLLNSLVRVISRERRKPPSRLFRKKLRVGIFVLAGLLAVLFVPKAIFWEPRVCWGDACVKVELAETRQARAQGLMARSSLTRDHGMLFVFPQEGFWSFWMKDTYIPLDLIWMNKDRQVVEIIRNAKPAPGVLDPPSFGGIYPSVYVLEVNAGFADKLGVAVGRKATFKWIFPQKRL